MKNVEQPFLHKRQSIEVGEGSHWPLYLRLEGGDTRARHSRAKPIAFEEGGRCLRIGSSVFLQNQEVDFKVQPPDSGEEDQAPAYFEEFASRPGLLVFASRRNNTKLDPESSSTEDPVQDLITLFAKAQSKRGEDSSSDTEESDTSTDDDEISSASSDDSWSSVNESWSEASTEQSDELEDENILDIFKGYGGSSESESSTDDESEETESEVSSGSDLGANPFARFRKGYHDDDSDADEAYVALDDSESDEGGMGRAFLAYIRTTRLKKQTEPDLQASIQVFSTSASGMKRLIRLRQPLHLPLYDSPPAIHPSLPLVVWPLGPSTVLFLDYERKHFFTRKLRPTTSMTRQVFIKCHFSPDGRYLHIATLEAHRKPLSRRDQRKQKKAAKEEKKKNDTNNNTDNSKETPGPDPLHLSLFLSTYRLDPTKPTRTPPAQIHRAKLALQAVRSLPVTRLPFAITWAPDHLYVTQSARMVRVHRVRLFPPHPPPPKEKIHSSSPSSSTAAADDPSGQHEDDDEGADLVLAEPRETVFLPSTAAARSVRFFPGTSAVRGNSASATAAARVLIGSETLASAKPLAHRGRHGGNAYDSNFDHHHGDVGGHQADAASDEPKFEGVQGLEGRAALPVGVYLREKEDLGGWAGSACGVRLPENRGMGRLDDKVERFDVDDDCDLEPYIV